MNRVKHWDKREGWSVLWRSQCRLDGRTEHLVHGRYHREVPAPKSLDWYSVVFFRTRKEAREYAERVYGDTRKRPDLRAEPHGWKPPKVVRVSCTVRVLPLLRSKRRSRQTPDYSSSNGRLK